MSARSLFAAALGLGLAGCTSTTPATLAQLDDPQALVRSGTEMFIASTHGNELRVLELNPDVTLRDFARAPNPLYPLSIPVVSRPVALAVDTDGTRTGRFVFVLSAVEARLGIVDTVAKVELAEVALPGTPLSVVARTKPSADAPLPDGGSDGSAGATVYVGIANGRHGQIIAIDVPPASGLGPATPLAVTTLVDLEEAAPGALALSPDGATLAIGDLLADEPGGVGGLIWDTLSAPTAANPAGQVVASHRVLVGGPVGKLAFNPASATVAAGQLLYARVASFGCGRAGRCGGLQIIANGQPPQQSPGVPVLPIDVPGVVQDFDFAPDAVLDLPSAVGGQTPFTQLIGATSSDGHVYFVDALAGRLLDTNPLGPTATVVVHFDADGGELLGPDGGVDDGTGPQGGVTLAEGAARSELVSIEYQGVLPGLSGRPATVSGGALTDPSSSFTSLGVQPGDRVQLTGCSELTVAAVGADGHTLTFTTDPGCATATATYTVRAAGTAPYTVAGSVSGLLGRTQPFALFSSAAQYFYRPPGYDPTKAGIRFVMGSGDPVRGASWVFTVDSGVVPMESLSGASALFPGPIGWAPNLRKFYVGITGSVNSGNSELAEVDPASVIIGTSTNIGEYQ